MIRRPRWTGGTALALMLAAGVSSEIEGTQESPTPASGQAEPAPEPRVRSETPIADSVDRAVAKLIRERFSPCPTEEGVPCFPVTVEVQGHQYSVRETLENMELDSRPAPGPPTAAEMTEHGANPRSVSASIAFDPKAIVCKTRQLLRKIQGKSRTYYLYRLWDQTGERAVLRDHPLDPEELMPSPQVRYVPLGEYGDECEAVRAYLTLTHQVRARREAAEAPRGSTPDLELRSGDPPE